jgi:hypothetical protein
MNFHLSTGKIVFTEINGTPTRPTEPRAITNDTSNPNIHYIHMNP